MKLYNALTRKKENFIPLTDKEIKMYVCGITPYDTTHLGHAFTFIFYDVLTRFLIYKGYKVNYVQNVTDIDDDILRQSKKENKDWKELGEFWTNKFLEDMNFLNIQRPTHFVKATESINQMTDIISKLIKKGIAYEVSGNVYFKIGEFKEYGKLSRYNRNQMLLISKERGGDPNDPLKKNPLDFLLWQKAKEDEPSWESPFGKGRPGWHIECSSMVYKYLGEKIDIHGGGKDLIFPHHESEIAQIESFTNKKPFVKYWLHTAMVMYEGEKMAKSLGNLIMIDDLKKKYSANAIRFLLLSNCYRLPWEYSEDQMIESEKKIEIISNALKIQTKKGLKLKCDGYFEAFLKNMEDDLNIKDALLILYNLAKIILEESAVNDTSELSEKISLCISILGFKF